MSASSLLVFSTFLDTVLCPFVDFGLLYASYCAVTSEQQGPPPIRATTASPSSRSLSLVIATTSPGAYPSPFVVSVSGHPRLVQVDTLRLILEHENSVFA